ncbi:MAG TPA: SDR family oxidoreductase [Bacteroidia bacterium]|jgi:dehydrogenase/reductase SDR family protein 7B|nr:SDR family oxidoreductase [Bacteroidia bacterium]
MSSFFSGKVVWITGASSGIGEALVYELAKQNAKIILSARNENGLKQVAEKAGLKSENSLIIPFDLSDTSKVKEYVQNVLSKFSRIDFLINNGGMSQRSEALTTTEAVERNLMEVNYFGHVALSKAVLPVMIKQNSGHITVVSSIAGKFGFYLRSSYSAAKHALHGYFECLCLENEKNNIHVLMVCPGKIQTEISIKATKEDGSAHGLMDDSHKNAVKADKCAVKILQAIKANKKEVLIGGKEILAVTVKRFFPSLFYTIIRKQRLG